MSKRIIIYGGEMAGVCAALKAAETAPKGTSVTIILPYASTKPGGLATVGGLNSWDLQSTISSTAKEEAKFVYQRYGQQGTFKSLLPNGEESSKSPLGEKNETRKFYEIYTDSEGHYENEMATTLSTKLSNAGVYVISMMDIYDIKTSGSMPITIDKLYLKGIYRDSEGYIKWDNNTRVIEGDYFVDASEDGKLISFISPMSTGRYDWPTEGLDESGVRHSILENCEINQYHVARQQAAGLYFKVTNLNGQVVDENGNIIDVNHLYGGYEQFRNGGNTYYGEGNNPVYKYNVEHYNDNYMIKTYNIDRNGTGSSEFWANTFLLFKVDGRAHYRDLITKFYPKAMISDTEDTDSAWIKGKKIIGSNEFENALKGYGIRMFDKDSDADVIGPNITVVKTNGEPVVADALYIRETVHLPIAMSFNNNSESNYAITKNETIMAENDTIKDSDNYTSRIGLGYYYQDIHPYLISDKIVKESNIRYVAEDDLSRYRMRPDVYKKTTPDNAPPKSEFINKSEPKEVYIPFETIYTERAANLLVPGNAASVGSFPWGEMRVLPNQCVWGDAAGIAFALCVEENCTLEDLYNDLLTLYENEDNLSIFSTANNKFLKFQEELRKNGACLDKPTATTPYFTSYPTNQEETNE